MGLLDNILGGGATAGNNAYSVPIPFIPQNLQQLMQMPYAALTNEFEVAALTVAVLCNYCQNPQATIEMLNYLRGPRPLSQMEIQFLRDRLTGKPYKMLSYLQGTSPQNNYTPGNPLMVTVMTTPYTYQNQDYATLYIPSSGADSPRQLDLRRKPSTGQWFVWVTDGLMPDIRVPVSQNPWA
ncbi:MAG: hypothetical protein IKX39_06395 [Muribaculaceae bacterium]|nr:hypothetical protein [Muribaculaceae bacterium]